MRGLPRPDVPPGPRRALVDALHDLHHRAGWPSLRTLARQAGCSHTTVSAVLSSPRLPSWGTLELLVEAMDGDVDDIHRLWVAASDPERTGPAGPAAIAGRREELAATVSHLRSGTGLLLLTGEAGIGKSRLASTAVSAVAEDCVVATGACLPLSTEVPMLPLADVLQDVYAVDGGRWVREALADAPPYVLGSLRHLVPELGDADGSGAGPRDDLSRRQLFAAVAAATKALGSLRRLVLLIEDLHWADTATLDLLEHLLVRDAGVPLLGTWRADDPTTPAATAEWLTRVRRLPTVSELELRLLSRDETAEQLALLSGRPPDDELVASVHDRSRGQPLFTEQLAVHQGGNLPLPTLLADLLDQQLAPLGAPAWSVARALGVADRGLTDRQLRDVTGLTPDALTASLRELGSRHLLHPATAPAEVQLRHPLLAEAIRRRQVAGEAPELHRRLATVLAASAEHSAAEIALHWQRAGSPEQELLWRIRAAREARTRYATSHESQQWRRALELWPGDTDTVGGERLCHVLMAALEVQELVDATAADGLVDRALALAPALPEPDAAALYQRVAVVRDADREDALSLLSRAIAIYESLPPSVDHIEALERRAWLLSVWGRYDEAAASLEVAARMAEQVGDPFLIRDTLGERGWQLAGSGDLDGGLRMIDRAHRTVLPHLDPPGEVELAITHTDVLLSAEADVDEVLAVGLRALDIAREWGMETGRVATLQSNVAQALRRAGQVQRALEVVSSAAARPPGPNDAHEHMEWACLTALRGDGVGAAEMFGRLEELGSSRVSFRRELAEATATGLLWHQRPGPVLGRLVTVIEETADTGDSANLGTLLVLAARAAADAAAGSTSRAGSTARVSAAATLVALLERCRWDPFAPNPGKAAHPALAATWRAELARLTGDATVETWLVAATGWDQLLRPTDAAYCRWRAAQVAIADGRGTPAAQLLRRAARDAREHVPLSEAIRTTGSVSRPGHREGSRA